MEVVTNCDHLAEGVRMADGNGVIATEQIESKILLIRGRRVILDADLARLYGTSTKALN